MYCEGDIVKYRTSNIKTQHSELLGKVKYGMIEESLSTLDGFPCYWIYGEKELVLGKQIIEKIELRDKNEKRIEC